MIINIGDYSLENRYFRVIFFSKELENNEKFYQNNFRSIQREKNKKIILCPHRQFYCLPGNFWLPARQFLIACQAILFPARQFYFLPGNNFLQNIIFLPFYWIWTLDLIWDGYFIAICINLKDINYRASFILAENVSFYFCHAGNCNCLCRQL